MLAIGNTHSRVPLSTPLNLDQDALCNAWQQWATESTQAGEQRQQALLRLLRCLQLNKPKLDLSQLNLTWLPSCWPASITQLYLSGNQLTVLPTVLPASLQQLDVNNNKLTQLPDHLPPFLRELSAKHNLLTQLPSRLPPSLNELDVRYNQLAVISPVLRQSVKWLYFDHNPIMRTTALAHYFARIRAAADSAPLLRQQLKTLINYAANEEHHTLHKQLVTLAQQANRNNMKDAFYFNQMYLAMIAHRLVKPSTSIVELLSINLTLFQLHVLQQWVANEVLQNGHSLTNRVEQIETYFRYQYQLQPWLSLSIDTPPIVTDNPPLSSNQLNSALETIYEQQRHYFMAYLIHRSASWRIRLAEWGRVTSPAMNDEAVDQQRYQLTRQLLMTANLLPRLTALINQGTASPCVKGHNTVIEAWQTWAAETGDPNRLCALKRLKDCINNNQSELDLSHLNLSILPEQWPPSIVKLYLAGNQLTTLPDCLPCSLRELHLGSGQLTALPPLLPSSLEIVRIGFHKIERLPALLPPRLRELRIVLSECLISLPTQWPISLEILDISGIDPTLLAKTALPPHLRQLSIGPSKLTALPLLPDSLEELDVSYSRLASLPALPASLKKLNVSFNPLIQLPTQWPVSLEILDISGMNPTLLAKTALPPHLRQLSIRSSKLTALPLLPNSLKELDVQSNQLTSLPVLPTGLEYFSAYGNKLSFFMAPLPPGLRYLDMSNNQLTLFIATLPPTLPYLDLKNNSLDCTPSETDGLNPSFHLVTSSVHTDAMRAISMQIPGWQKIEHQIGTHIFIHLLQRFISKHQPHFNAPLKAQVSDLLHYIVHNEAWRAPLFLMLEQASITDEASALFYFNKIYLAMIEDQLINGHPSVTALFDTNRLLFRLQLLRKIAAEVMKKRQKSKDWISEITLYLVYQTALQRRFSLPIQTGFQAHLSGKELKIVVETVYQLEQRDFLRYLVMESTSWQRALKRWDQDQVKAVEAACLAMRISESFYQHVNNLLITQGRSINDVEARSIVTKQQTETLLYQKRYPLTRQFLQAHQALSLITPFDLPDQREQAKQAEGSYWSTWLRKLKR